MYSVRSKVEQEFPDITDEVLKWKVNQLGLVRESDIAVVRNNKQAWDVLGGPDVKSALDGLGISGVVPESPLFPISGEALLTVTKDLGKDFPITVDGKVYQFGFRYGLDTSVCAAFILKPYTISKAFTQVAADTTLRLVHTFFTPLDAVYRSPRNILRIEVSSAASLAAADIGVCLSSKRTATPPYFNFGKVVASGLNKVVLEVELKSLWATKLRVDTIDPANAPTYWPSASGGDNIIDVNLLSDFNINVYYKGNGTAGNVSITSSLSFMPPMREVRDVSKNRRAYIQPGQGVGVDFYNTPRRNMLTVIPSASLYNKSASGNTTTGTIVLSGAAGQKVINVAVGARDNLAKVKKGMYCYLAEFNTSARTAGVSEQFYEYGSPLVKRTIGVFGYANTVDSVDVANGTITMAKNLSTALDERGLQYDGGSTNRLSNGIIFCDAETWSVRTGGILSGTQSATELAPHTNHMITGLQRSSVQAASWCAGSNFDIVSENNDILSMRVANLSGFNGWLESYLGANMPLDNTVFNGSPVYNVSRKQPNLRQSVILAYDNVDRNCLVATQGRVYSFDNYGVETRASVATANFNWTTADGGKVVVNWPDHGFPDGLNLETTSISASPNTVPAGFRGTFNITVIDKDTFSYPVASNPGAKPGAAVLGVDVTYKKTAYMYRDCVSDMYGNTSFNNLMRPTLGLNGVSDGSRADGKSARPGHIMREELAYLIKSDGTLYSDQLGESAAETRRLATIAYNAGRHTLVGLFSQSQLRANTYWPNGLVGGATTLKAWKSQQYAHIPVVVTPGTAAKKGMVAYGTFGSSLTPMKVVVTSIVGANGNDEFVGPVESVFVCDPGMYWDLTGVTANNLTFQLIDNVGSNVASTLVLGVPAGLATIAAAMPNMPEASSFVYPGNGVDSGYGTAYSGTAPMGCTAFLDPALAVLEDFIARRVGAQALGQTGPAYESLHVDGMAQRMGIQFADTATNTMDVYMFDKNLPTPQIDKLRGSYNSIDYSGPRGVRTKLIVAQGIAPMELGGKGVAGAYMGPLAPDLEQLI